MWAHYRNPPAAARNRRRRILSSVERAASCGLRCSLLTAWASCPGWAGIVPAPTRLRPRTSLGGLDESPEDKKEWGILPHSCWVAAIRAAGKKDSYLVTGTLTIKKTSRVVDIPFTAVPKGEGWVFTGEFSINRRDYDVGGSSTISNALTVNINVLAR